MGPSMSHLYEGSKSIYYVSSVLSFLVVCLFDAVIKFFEVPSKRLSILKYQFKIVIMFGNYNLANLCATQIYNKLDNLNDPSKHLMAMEFARRFVRSYKTLDKQIESTKQLIRACQVLDQKQNAFTSDMHKKQEIRTFAIQWLEKAQTGDALLNDNEIQELNKILQVNIND